MLKTKLIASLCILSPLLLVGFSATAATTHEHHQAPAVAEAQEKEFTVDLTKLSAEDRKAYNSMAKGIDQHYKNHLKPQTKGAFNYVGYKDLGITSQSGDALDFIYTIKVMRGTDTSTVRECELQGWYDLESGSKGYGDFVLEECQN